MDIEYASKSLIERGGILGSSPNSMQHFDEAQATRLGAFLGASQRPEGTMSYFECAGFLFTVACAPELIKPSEWMSIIFNEGDAVYDSMEEAQDILQSLMALYNDINRQVREADVNLPPSCVVRDNPLDNLKADSPLSQWAQGFMTGYDWLVELWDEYTPEDLSEELGSQMMVLSFFASRKLAKAYLEETKRKDHSLKAMAAQMLDLLPDAMTGFAHLGYSIQQALQEHQAEQRQPARSEKIGRNEPCPCGSGKKYKQCCGTSLH